MKKPVYTLIPPMPSRIEIYGFDLKIVKHEGATALVRVAWNSKNIGWEVADIVWDEPSKVHRYGTIRMSRTEKLARRQFDKFVRLAKGPA